MSYHRLGAVAVLVAGHLQTAWSVLGVGLDWPLAGVTVFYDMSVSVRHGPSAGLVRELICESPVARTKGHLKFVDGLHRPKL